MTRGAAGHSITVWPLSAIGSVATHGLIVAALAYSAIQRPLPQQDPPQARIELTDRSVQSQTAETVAPAGTTAKAGAAGGTPLGQALPAPERLAATAPPGEALPALQSQSPPQIAAALPVTQVAATATPPPVAAVAPRETMLAAAAASPEPVQAQVLPATARIATAPQGSAAPEVSSAGTAVTAELAWSGEAAPRDPVSIAAIAGFASADTSTPGAEKLRDGLEALLTSVPCGRMQTAFDPATGALELRGHVPQEALRAGVLAQLQAQIGPDIPVTDKLHILPAPQCAALDGIAAIGLPQSAEQALNPRIVGPDTFARDYSFFDGQRLALDLQGPDYTSLVYVDYYDAGGNVIHLQPNDQIPLEEIAPKQAFSVGREVKGKPALTITISPPFGQEITVAMAASQRLYDQPRPMVEPAAPYLEFMRERVADLRAANPGFKGEWVYFFISTAGVRATQ